MAVVLFAVWWRWRWSGGATLGDLRGKVCVISGARGIGGRTGVGLLRQGAHVIFGVRRPEAVQDLLAEMAAETGNDQVEAMELDVSSLRSVCAFASEFRARGLELHVLVNNAGVLGMGWGRTEEGVERTWATNHLGHFLLTCLLAPVLVRSAPARVVNMSSVLHGYVSEMNEAYCERGEDAISSFQRYNVTKAANVLFSAELARRLEGTGVTSNVLHPGNVITDVTAHFAGPCNGIVKALATAISWVTWTLGFTWTIIPAAKGGDGPIYVAASTQVEGVTGQYFFITRQCPSSALTQRPDLHNWLWGLSWRQVKDALPDLEETDFLPALRSH